MELDARREEWAGEARGQRDFAIILRGGAWTATTPGVMYDHGVRAEATGWEAWAFCALYGFQKTASFAFCKYGEDSSTALANEWCRRLQLYFDVWNDCEQQANLQFPDDLAMTTESDEFKSLMDTQAPSSATHKRGLQLRQMKPCPR